MAAFNSSHLDIWGLCEFKLFLHKVGLGKPSSRNSNISAVCVLFSYMCGITDSGLHLVLSLRLLRGMYDIERHIELWCVSHNTAFCYINI